MPNRRSKLNSPKKLIGVAPTLSVTGGLADTRRFGFAALDVRGRRRRPEWFGRMGVRKDSARRRIVLTSERKTTGLQRARPIARAQELLG